ncbi:hypothetical protein AMS68_006760 [Peltaster fructicola]|uniref:HAUS augmin-like complex subunit 3 N-terminal domain-containing protein n=1 Tax=Peltaster fructicola TaxID=286661 RepID=A0A6H0Y2K1_9PEZI|nr:hypothetical protein AMS68_006760 [Peltaster fructicola]
MRSDAWEDILQARALHIDHDVLNAANSHTLDAWISEHAQPENLLTKEELSFSHKIGVVLKDCSTKSVPDDAFEDAVSFLQASIASIDQQCKILEEHKTALTRLRMQQAASGGQEVMKQNSQKNIKERASFELANDRLAAEMRTQLNDHNRGITAVLDSEPNSITKAFEKDDRILDGLQKIVPRLDANEDERVSPEAVNTLCDRWIALERQAMRRRVDDTYDDALKTSSSSTAISINGTAENRAVRAELTELSSEVDGLITLVAEHHHRALIMRSLDQARRDAEAESAKWSEYTACVLLYLTARLEALHDMYERSHVHKAALAALGTELDDVLVTKVVNDPQTGRKREPVHAGRGLKPLRLVQATFNDSQDTTSQILKLLNVRVAEGVDDGSLQQSLASALRQRSIACAASLRQGNEGQARAAARSTGAYRQHSVALSDAIGATASVAGGNLVGAELQTSLAAFQARTDELARDMHALDLDSIARGITSL